MNLSEAVKLLKQYSCTLVKIPGSEAEKKELQTAVIDVVNASEWENLGICADNSESGCKILTSYLKALGYPVEFDRALIKASNSPVYIKYNTQKLSHHLDSYDGDYRGVLISCQTENDAIAGTYGYFPADLFNGLRP